VVLQNETVGPVVARALTQSRATVKEDTIVLHAEITPEMIEKSKQRQERRQEKREQRKKKDK